MVGLPSGLQLGDVVAGKYRLVREIGAGAMGIVVAAHHLNLDRTVAIKFMIGGALAGPDAISRFVREARMAARITSQHVVRVYDVAVLPNGIPYMELEYLEGCDVAARLRQVGRLPVPQAVDFVLQACEAIAEAHALGIVHRDLKPANLFVTSGSGIAEAIKVLDFGISKVGDSVSSTLPTGASPAGSITTAPGPIGSPLYMSPEQMQSARDVDARTDVWALGVILCELVTGEVPYRGGSIVELYSMIRSGEPLRLHQRFPDLPGALESIILKCLRFDRELRFPDVNALATALIEMGARSSAPSPVGETQVSARAAVAKSGLLRSARAVRWTVALVFLFSAAVGAILIGSRVMTSRVRAASSSTIECIPADGMLGACMAPTPEEPMVDPAPPPASASAETHVDNIADAGLHPEAAVLVARAPPGVAPRRKPPSPHPSSPGAAGVPMPSVHDVVATNVPDAATELASRANPTTPSAASGATNPASQPSPEMSSLGHILEDRK